MTQSFLPQDRHFQNTLVLLPKGEIEFRQLFYFLVILRLGEEKTVSKKRGYSVLIQFNEKIVHLT